MVSYTRKDNNNTVNIARATALSSPPTWASLTAVVPLAGVGRLLELFSHHHVGVGSGLERLSLEGATVWPGEGAAESVAVAEGPDVGLMVCRALSKVVGLIVGAKVSKAWRLGDMVGSGDGYCDTQ